jgi:hypothetical protein
MWANMTIIDEFTPSIAAVEHSQSASAKTFVCSSRLFLVLGRFEVAAPIGVGGNLVVCRLNPAHVGQNTPESQDFFGRSAANLVKRRKNPWPQSCVNSGRRELGGTSWRLTAPCTSGDVKSPHVARHFRQVPATAHRV